MKQIHSTRPPTYNLVPGQRHYQKKLQDISLMSIDAKILKKFLPGQIQQHIKRIIHHEQVGFIPRTQEWYNIHK